ncbi:MAG: hypothetical protein U0694_22980 [Anaerolineae bacterium]
MNSDIQQYTEPIQQVWMLDLTSGSYTRLRAIPELCRYLLAARCYHGEHRQGLVCHRREKWAAARLPINRWISDSAAA